MKSDKFSNSKMDGRLKKATVLKAAMFGFFALVLLFSLSVHFVSADSSDTCNLKVSLVNQDPNPAVPGEYVNVLFQVTGVETYNCANGARFELIPSYPFSLDGNDSSEVLEKSTWVAGDYNSAWTIPYKLKVDKDAFDGDAQIMAKYSYGSSDANSITQSFNITIQDSRTNFDAVIQEVSGSAVSIAIANIGKYAANSVVVRIPEQDSFMASGTDGQMVGNLESGDYTIVGFTIVRKGNATRNMTWGALPVNMTKGVSSMNLSQSNELKFDIYYTDNIGERRIVNMELPLSIAGNSSMGGAGGFSRTGTKTTSSKSKSWIILVIILCVLIAAYVLYRKYPKQAKELLHKINKQDSKKSADSAGSKIPDWIKNAKGKEKRR